MIQYGLKVRPNISHDKKRFKSYLGGKDDKAFIDEFKPNYTS